MKKNKKIVLTGGGTAGHCMPNIYLLPALKDNFEEILYIGSNGIEKKIIEKENIPYYSITTTKFNRGKIIKNFELPFKLIKSIKQSKKILKKINPDIIFSKGGFVSLPVCIAGKQLKIPIISHESDLSIGLANKIIYNYCDFLCTNFDLSTKKDKKLKIITTGAIMPDNLKIDKEKANKNGLNLNKDKKTLLVVGGSQGAVKINEFFLKNANTIEQKYNIIHIVGDKNYNDAKKILKEYKSNNIKGLLKADKKSKAFDSNIREANTNSSNISKTSKNSVLEIKSTSLENYNILQYSYDMASMYALSDIIVSRAGAGSIFESLYLKKLTLLIPLENKASRGDQIENAKYFENKKTLKILEEKNLNYENFEHSINYLIKNQKKILNNIEKLDIFSGKEKIINLITKLSNK